MSNRAPKKLKNSTLNQSYHITLVTGTSLTLPYWDMLLLVQGMPSKVSQVKAIHEEHLELDITEWAKYEALRGPLDPPDYSYQS